jgi:rhodanese-related sulfurtransferase
MTSAEAWQALRDDSRAVLVDVRTEAEWRFVGTPDLNGIGKETVLLSWQHYPEMKVNASFAAELREKGVGAEATVLLLCRSGARSHHAAVALAAFGFGNCYNVSDGFEGPRDDNGRRSAKAGWKQAGLPWSQE